MAEHSILTCTQAAELNPRDFSKTHRNWYPTQQEAQKHYAKIKLSVNGLQKELIVPDENITS
jgi:hypothetical protein